MNKLIIILLFFPAFSFSQIPDSIVLKADSILIKNFSKEFFNKVFRYNCEESAHIINHSNWHGCYDYTRKQKRFYKKELRKHKDNTYEIVYDYLLLDTIPTFVRIRLRDCYEIT